MGFYIIIKNIVIRKESLCIVISVVKKSNSIPIIVHIAADIKDKVEKPCAYHMNQDMKKAYEQEIENYQQKYDSVTSVMGDNGLSSRLYTRGYYKVDFDNDGNAKLLISWQWFNVRSEC